tara:strand:+ start:177 stop:1814 length:1638 start_codon:yes stop_codon:yes gene_type:complete
MENMKDLGFNKNEDNMNLLIGELKHHLSNSSLGGGKKSIEKHKQKGKLTAKERIYTLIDSKTEFLEIGSLAAMDMYKEYGGCNSAGVLIGIGTIHNKKCMIVANDATVKAGAWFPMTAKKNLRAQEIAIENKLPIIYLVDSAGIFLPLQNDIFADKEHFGRQFRNNAILSSMGVPQIAAIMGSCVAGGAYLPIMCDETIIVEGTGSVFLAGSHLVKAAIGEIIDNETLGGAKTHAEKSGTADYICKNDKEAVLLIRDLIEKTSDTKKAGFLRKESMEPKENPKEILGIIPKKRDKQYNMLDVILRLVDESKFIEYKKDYGKTIICGYARIDGWEIGIVANQRTIVKNGKGEMQIGGVIYSESADKSARFIMNCNQKKIPLIFLQDVTGFMVGSKSEHGGIIKDGAKMVNAMANSTVPKFTVIIGNSYGAGNYAMCGKAYDPRLIIAWPTARIAVMGGDQASDVLFNLEKNRLKKMGEEISETKEKSLKKTIKDNYNNQTSPYYAASRLWVDQIINPLETRKYLSMGIEISNNNPIKEFKTGVIQT